MTSHALDPLPVTNCHTFSGVTYFMAIPKGLGVVGRRTRPRKLGLKVQRKRAREWEGRGLRGQIGEREKNGRRSGEGSVAEWG